MPYPESHSCEIDLTLKVLGSQVRKHGTKSYTVKIGRKPGRTKGSSERSYMYDAKEWSASEARAHCKDHGGKFVPATGKKEK